MKIRSWLPAFAVATATLAGCRTSTAPIDSKLPYWEEVANVYTDAWLKLGATNEHDKIVKVSVTIARDGRVLSSTIVQTSGDENMDKSVQSVLKEVDRVPPFEVGATNEARKFVIKFDSQTIADHPN